ncbi:MAG: hypothetical protein EAZ91_14110 [Cytophagales bacterium]|nr:MAG: hypothetical protein EAZ91_14110 [Cytophagales bacterium]
MVYIEICVGWRWLFLDIFVFLCANHVQMAKGLYIKIMRTKQITATVILDTRRAKDGGTYPIKLRITYGGQRDYFPLGETCDCTPETWEIVLKQKGGGKAVHDIRQQKAEAEGRAAKIIQQFKAMDRPFTFDAFRKAYLIEADPGQVRKQNDDVFAAIKTYAETLKEEGRISSGQSYDCLLSSLRKFHGRKRLTFAEVNPAFLKRYHKFMETEGGKKGNGQRAAGIGIYMRNFRRILNIAVDSKIILAEDYPFGPPDKGKYQPPTGGNVKKALSIEQVRALRDYPLPDGSRIARGRDLWYFSFICNGMNMKDICLLRWSDIDGDVMHFLRAKTSKTAKEQKYIRVILERPALEIIARWSNPDKRPSAYVFPFMKVGATPLQVRYITQDVTSSVNDAVKQVAAELDINQPITTYWARHSWATQMMKENAPVKIIQDGLGHTSLAMTSRYTDELPVETQRKYSSTLI